jgi:hypothetical protein
MSRLATFPLADDGAWLHSVTVQGAAREQLLTDALRLTLADVQFAAHLTAGSAVLKTSVTPQTGPAVGYYSSSVNVGAML